MCLSATTAFTADRVPLWDWVLSRVKRSFSGLRDSMHGGGGDDSTVTTNRKPGLSARKRRKSPQAFDRRLWIMAFLGDTFVADSLIIEYSSVRTELTCTILSESPITFIPNEERSFVHTRRFCSRAREESKTRCERGRKRGKPLPRLLVGAALRSTQHPHVYLEHRRIHLDCSAASCTCCCACPAEAPGMDLLDPHNANDLFLCPHSSAGEWL